MTAHDQPLGFHTRAAKTYLDSRSETRPLSVPLVRATNFQVHSSKELGDSFRRRDDQVYTRFGHPTLSAAAERLAAMDGADAGLVFSSGMAAITSTLLAITSAGDHVVAQRDVFAQTFTFLDSMARSFGIITDFVDATDPEQVERAVRPETRVIYIETPSNPLLKVIDIDRIGRIARRNGVLLLVDSTFASPYLQQPLALGATLCLQSGTKFLGGHSDVMCGVVTGSADLMPQIKEAQILLGGILDPEPVWLLLRGLKTLGLRVQRQSDTALRVARFLKTQDGVLTVHYPWLEGTPYYELARQQMTAGGGVLSFEVEGGLEGARAFSDALQLIRVATSLGGVETIIEIPYDLDFGADQLGEAASEVTPGMIRLSVGLEDYLDLERDLARGLCRLPSNDPMLKK